MLRTPHDRVLIPVIICVVLGCLGFLAFKVYGHAQRLAYIDAASSGNSAKLSAFLSRGMDPNLVDEQDLARNKTAASVLELAIASRNPDAVAILMRHGAKVNTTVLASAGRLPEPAVGMALVDNGVDKQTLLESATQNGNAALVQALVERFPEIKGSLRGKQRLLTATTQGNAAMIGVLLANGVEIEEKDEYGNTPLMRAAMTGDPNLTKLLLERGADSAARNSKGKTAADYARMSGHVEAMNLLAAGGKRNGALAAAKPAALSKAYAIQARDLSRQGNGPAEVEARRKAVDANPADVDTRLALVYSLLRGRRLEEALPEIEQCLRLRPDSSLANAYHGAILEGLQRYPEAIDALRKAGRLDPKSYFSAFKLAEVLEYSGRLPEAAQAYRSSLVLLNDTAAHVRLGRVLMKQQQFGAARAEFQRAIDLHSRNSVAYYYISLVDVAEGRQNDAVSTLRKSGLPYGPEPDLHFLLASLLYSQSDRVEAVEEYRRGLRLAPDEGMAYVNLGWALIELGRTQEAVDACRHAVQLLPRDSNAHANLGLALTMQGLLQPAFAECNRALGLDSGNAEARYYLALALEKAGQKEEAARELQTYVTQSQKLSSEQERIWDARARLARVAGTPSGAR